MPFRHIQSLKIYQFENLTDSAIDHAVLTRHGGVSTGVWRSLNIGSTVGDSPQRVRTNKELLPTVWGGGGAGIYEVWQVHSKRTVVAVRSSDQAELKKADAIITDEPGLALLMRFADCVPILLWDPVHKAIGIVHSGWRGTVEQIAHHAVRTMSDAFGSTPAEIVAGIGPSIGPDHYEIGDEVFEALAGAMGSEASDFFKQDGQKFRLDLWRSNEAILRDAGVKQIEIAGICTACNLDDWYSHRAEQGKTGRFGAFIRLNEQKKT